MTDILIRDVHKSFGVNDVLTGCSAEIFAGDKVGLIGVNGSGKTTLFRIISGQELPDKGSVQIPSTRKVGLLDQIPRYADETYVRDVLESAFIDLLALKAQLDDAILSLEIDPSERNLDRYGRLQVAFEARGGYDMQHRFNLVTQGLKIDAAMQNKQFSDLSGGEKTRVNLGRIMLLSTDILLLDEPTNHLDIASVEWLESYICDYTGTVVVISHDRYFLDRTVRKIIEIEDGLCTMFPGAYSAYGAFKEQKRIEQLQHYATEQKKIKQLEEAVKRMHDWAQRADNPKLHKRAFSMEKRLTRMQDGATKKPKVEQKLKSRFREDRFSGMEAIVAEDVWKCYGEKTVLSGTEFILYKGQSVALLGANGCGKTTLLRIVLGECEADTGFVKIGPSIKVGYLPQEIVFTHPERTVVDTIRYEWPMEEGKARNLLAGYGFTGEDVFKPVAKLSGGEKSRLRLFMLMQDEVNLLVLDEPTNHLDIRSREWVEEAISGFHGSILFVSHDRYFIRRFATRILTMKNGLIESFEDDYDAYRFVQEELREQEAQDALQLELTTSATDRMAAKERQRMLGSWQKKVDSDEADIHKAEKRIFELDQSMHDSPVDAALLLACIKEKEALVTSLNELYQRWEINQLELEKWRLAEQPVQ